MEKLMEILKELRPEVDFENNHKLIDGGVLDSFDLVALIGELNEAFEVEIEFDDIDAENFNSAKAIMELVKRLQEEE